MTGLLAARSSWSMFRSFSGAVVHAQNAAALRRLTIILITLKAAGCLAAVWTRLMLHGDGSFFVYALSVGEPWALKWSDIPARSAIYVLTVMPSQWLTRAWSLSPLEATALNGFFFYAVPIIQFAIAAALMWRAHAKYLIFPITQYCLSTVFGFGFPSEILLAPGFLWICAALLLRGQSGSIWFALSLTGLLLSHELAVPAAIVISWIAVGQARRHQRNDYLPLTLSAIFVAFATFLTIRLAWGGPGSDGGAIYVFDPRRVLNNPTFFLAALITCGALVWARWRSASRIRPRHFVMLFVLAFLIPILVGLTSPGIDFEQGRYDSARTLIGLVMFLLSLAFAVNIGGQTENYTGDRGRVLIPFAMALVTMLAAASGGAARFVHDWSVALGAFESVVVSAAAASPDSPTYLPYKEARRLMSQREAALNDKMDFHWVLPYRSAVLADGAMPGIIVHNEDDLGHFCDISRSLEPGRPFGISQELNSSLTDFACSYEAPPRPPTRRDIAKQRLRDFMSKFSDL